MVVKSTYEVEDGESLSLTMVCEKWLESLIHLIFKITLKFVWTILIVLDAN